MSQIVWLASYPKSGNTWLRIFLANFQARENRPADINDLDAGGISSDRCAADNALGVECSDLTPDELDRYRPAVYRNVAQCSEKDLFIKIHDAYTFNSNAEPLIPADVTRAAVYLVRNPLDVAVSFAHHANEALNDTVDRMSRETMTFAEHHDRLDLHLPQRLMSWSQHVLSWLDQRAIPVRVMRYEDMYRRPVEEFTETIRFIGLEVDVERVRLAVAFSSFETLRQQELKHGFREKPYGAASFFRGGGVDGWRETLTKSQVERLVHDHGAVMRRLGYLSESGCPE
jgi:aryl sulfotransferase